MNKPIPASMMPESGADNNTYVDWVLMRCTSFYALRMGAGHRSRQRVDFDSPREAIIYVMANPGWLCYGVWTADLRSDLVPQRLYKPILNGEFVPYYYSDEPAPDGTWMRSGYNLFRLPRYTAPEESLLDYYPPAAKEPE